MKKSSKYSFKGKTTKNAESRKRNSGFGYLLSGDLEIFKPEADSKVILDIMPYEVTIKNHPDRDDDAEIAVEGSMWYKRPFKVHRNIGARNEAVICLQTIGKKCPVCEYQTKLKKEDGDDEAIRALRPTDKNLYVVVVLKIDGKKQKRKLQLFEFSDFLFQEVFEAQLSDKEEFESFPDPYEGSSIDIKFAEGNLGGNKYPEPTRFDFVKRVEQYDDEFLSDIPNLEDCFKILTYEELKNKLFEIQDDEDEDEEMEERPTKKSSKKHVEEEVEDDNEDEDDDEDEEEEEKPKARQRKRTVSNDTKKSKKALECPEGHRFGIDTDKFEECEDCDIWNECVATKKAKK